MKNIVFKSLITMLLSIVSFSIMAEDTLVDNKLSNFNYLQKTLTRNQFNLNSTIYGGSNTLPVGSMLDYYFSTFIDETDKANAYQHLAEEDNVFGADLRHSAQFSFVLKEPEFNADKPLHFFSIQGEILNRRNISGRFAENFIKLLFSGNTQLNGNTLNGDGNYFNSIHYSGVNLGGTFHKYHKNKWISQWGLGVGYVVGHSSLQANFDKLQIYQSTDLDSLNASISLDYTQSNYKIDGETVDFSTGTGFLVNLQGKLISPNQKLKIDWSARNLGSINFDAKRNRTLDIELDEYATTPEFTSGSNDLTDGIFSIADSLSNLASDFVNEDRLLTIPPLFNLSIELASISPKRFYRFNVFHIADKVHKPMVNLSMHQKLGSSMFTNGYAGVTVLGYGKIGSILGFEYSQSDAHGLFFNIHTQHIESLITPRASHSTSLLLSAGLGYRW